MITTIDSFAVHENLARYSTYEIGGTARFFAKPASVEELLDALQSAQGSGLAPVFFGMGSNLLFPDRPDPDSLYVSTRKLSGFRIQQGKLFAAAGTPMSALAVLGRISRFSGFEFTFLLPGTLGGGIYMNAKYFGSQISDILDTVYYLDLAAVQSGLQSIKAEACGFAYKESIFQHHPWLIAGADLKAELTPQLEEGLGLLARHREATHLSDSGLKGFASLYMNVVSNPLYGEHPVSSAFEDTIRDRMGKRHFDYPSCGSVFKNNYSFGVPIGKLVEELNLRGMEHGNARISTYHGNMIWNTGGATAAEVLYLLEFIQEAVNNRFGFVPEPELVIL